MKYTVPGNKIHYFLHVLNFNVPVTETFMEINTINNKIPYLTISLISLESLLYSV
jgi:hypothetical protein